ncbi:MAG: non-heme iron oxygenase ferredoxin subunit [Pseudomonadota bacterium]
MYTPVLSMADLAEGQSTVVKVGDVEVLVCQVEGQFYAVHAQCSHARQSLATGRLRGFQISCPLHGARFDVRTGACTAAPAQKPIASFPVMLEGGKVCVQVGEIEQPPKPKFGPI